MSQDQLGLFDTPPNRQEIRLSLAIVGLLIVAALLILPVRDIRMREINAFVPMIDAIMFLGELITATLLYAQAAVFRSRALTVLATGYVCAALLLVPHALTFPGAFAPDGLLGAGVNTTGWIATFQRTAVPIAILLYVLLKRADSAAPPGPERPAARIAVGVLAAIVLAAAATLLTTSGHDWLPSQYINRSDLIYAHAVERESVVFALLAVVTFMLFRTRSSVLDMWLLVALSGWLIQSLLIMTMHGPIQRRLLLPVHHGAVLPSRRDARPDRRVQPALCAAGAVDSGAQSGARSPADVDGRGGRRHLP